MKKNAHVRLDIKTNLRRLYAYEKDWIYGIEWNGIHMYTNVYVK